MDFSVVVPVFNSEDSLGLLYERLQKVFADMAKSFEVIFVEDGSDDNSWTVLKELKKKHPDHIIAIKLNRNFGQHNATICGFGFAKGKEVITIDDDLQNPPEEIPKLIAAKAEDEADVTYGIYQKKQHSMVRNLLSKTVRKSHKWMKKGSGKGSSFRIIDQRIIKKILNHNQTFIFIDEVFLWYTDHISFTLVDHHKRTHSKSGYGAKKLFQLASNLTYFYTNIPLKIMVYSGFFVSFISFIIAIKFIIQKLFYDVPLGYTSMIVTILFSTSIIVFSLGVIGGYLSRMQLMQNKKPPYNIEKILDKEDED